MIRWQRHLLSRATRGKARLYYFGLIIGLLMGIPLSISMAVTIVPVDDWDVALDYGAFHRGQQFSDSLSFVYGGDTLRVAEVEATCDCVIPEPTGNGLLSFQFDVLPEERDGKTEKVLYVFTENPELDLLRVRLNIDVLPGEGPAATLYPDPVIIQDDNPQADVEPDTPAVVSEHLVKDTQLDVAFFASPGCRTCAQIKEHTIPLLKERWTDSISIHTVDIDTRLGFARLMAVREHYGVEQTSSSFLFAVGDTVLQTTTDLANQLDKAINDALTNNEQTYFAVEITAGESEQRTRSVFRSLGFWTVAGAGLLDGINPCAFATIVFFISLLSYAGSTKRQVLTVGIGFTATVFAVYLLLGLGAFKVLQALAAFSVVARVIWLLTVALLAVLFVLSVRDTIQYYRTGQTKDALLQLPGSTKRRIHASMRKGLKTRNLLIASIGIGAMVTLFEAACTGQVYLPAIVLMLNDPVMSEKAFLYLVVYNLLFIAPLIVVFLLTYAGVGSEAFADWSKKHYGLTRILLSLLFLALAMMMLGQAQF